MAKTWQLQPVVSREILEQFPELRSVVVQLLYNRGITDPERVEWFLNPDYHNLYDPFLFKEMQKGVDRVWQAIINQEKILIFGDYDADAVTANAVLQQTFRYLGVSVESYIPDRFTEGYGLNVAAFEAFKERGINVVITVDCGTNSIDVANYCNENNIDLVITDHHEITGETPLCHALINPKNPAEHYPDTQITGVGVAYKFAKALLMQSEQVITQKKISPLDFQPEWDKWLLDLVAIGTVADCHSLLGENRILVKFGLKVLLKTKWAGLRQLVENSGLDVKTQNPDSKTLGFTIAPRINAAGRLEHADIALALLVTGDFAEAITLANRVEEINRRRQDLTKRIVSEAREQAELMLDRKILLLYNEAWPKGLVGIVAGKLAEQYGKPTIVLEQGTTESTGSARSSGDFDMVACLKAVSHRLLRFGGHKQAAGLTAHTSQLPELYAEILKYADEHWPEEAPDPMLSIDAELREEDLTFDSYDDIMDLEPFGQGNPKPVFMVRDATVSSMRVVGSSKQHLQLQVLVGQTVLDSIGFSMARLTEKITVGSVVTLVGELMTDSWKGNKKLKMRIIDTEVSVVSEMAPAMELDALLEI